MKRTVTSDWKFIRDDSLWSSAIYGAAIIRSCGQHNAEVNKTSLGLLQFLQLFFYLSDQSGLFWLCPRLPNTSYPKNEIKQNNVLKYVTRSYFSRGWRSELC